MPPMRNVKILQDGSFEESAHPSFCGSLDMEAVMKAYYDIGYTGYMSPAHGRMIWNEEGKPGYGLYDRALGAVYLYRYMGNPERRMRTGFSQNRAYVLVNLTIIHFQKTADGLHQNHPPSIVMICPVI
mgnify:CR=1 FL=1